MALCFTQGSPSTPCNVPKLSRREPQLESGPGWRRRDVNQRRAKNRYSHWSVYALGKRRGRGYRTQVSGAQGALDGCSDIVWQCRMVISDAKPNGTSKWGVITKSILYYSGFHQR